MIELRAKHPMSNMQIIERFIDGVRFMKITPKSMMPAILDNVKKMFVGKPVIFEVSESGWIKITKTDRDEKMEEGVKKISPTMKDEIDERGILEKEGQMLSKQGFEVKIKEIDNE